MRAVCTVHPHPVDHILVRNGIQPELVQESLKLFRRALLLHFPYGLGKGICAAPGADVYGTGVILVREFYKQVASGGIVIGPYDTYSGSWASHYGTAPDIFHTWPVAKFLLAVLFLQALEACLAGTIHKIVDIHSVCIYDTVKIFRPLRRVRVAVPSYGGYDRFNLKPVSIGHKTDGGLVVVRLNLRRSYIRKDYQARLELRLLYMRTCARGCYSQCACYKDVEAITQR